MQTILVVDDDAMFREMMRRQLAGLGFAVLEADNGKTGFEMMRRMRPSVCLLDILMEEQDGLETLAQMRALDERPPVIAISSDAFYLGCALDLGADAGIVKPVSIDELCSAIRQLGFIA